jgi:hypothetical protein
VFRAADVIARAMRNHSSNPMLLAEALESAQLLQSPETAAELEAEPLAWAEQLDADSLGTFLHTLGMATDIRPIDGALAQVREVIRSFREGLPAGAEDKRTRTLHDHRYERPADEDPIRYTLTEQAEGDLFVPRTERQRWQDIAAALNAAHAAGMPVGIDLDGTLTDHRMWSVVWDRDAERWTVAGYEDDAGEAAFVGCDSCGTPDLCAPAGSCARLKQPREDDVTPQVAKLRSILAGQREQSGGASC